MPTAPMPTAPTTARLPRPAARQVTPGRILDAAERLFLDHGYDGTSSRMITAAARVNLAAVNYHFGGKSGLFEAMLARRLDGLHEARLALLEADLASAGGKPLPCERILGALFIPALALARDARRGGADFLRLLGRAYVDPSPALRAFLSERYAPSIARFKDAFAQALPHMAARELAWRLHFMMGALAYTLAGTDAWKLIAALNPTETGNDQRLLRRLAPFLIAGLQAPLPDLTRPDPAVALVRSRQVRGRAPTNKPGRPAVLPVRPARRAA
jgi:AcrR family transcriptional regulator